MDVHVCVAGRLRSWRPAVLASDAMSHDPLLVALAALKQRFPDYSDRSIAIVSISQQKLFLCLDGRVVKTYPVSTSRYGPGNEDGSYKTPLGVHCVRRKIGDDAPIGAIFKERENTRKVARIVNDQTETADDHITTRILWLAGLEPGLNHGEHIDSYSRYIYIHGTHEEGLIGQPVSHGCVRMTNCDVIELYDALHEDDLVMIAE